MRLLILLLILALAAARTAALAQSPATTSPPKEARRFALEVRAAPLGDVASQLSRAVGTSLGVQPELADQRITARAPEATIPEFSVAVQRLLRVSLPSASQPQGSFQIQQPPGTDASITAHLLGRRADFLRRLQEISSAMLRPNPERYVEDVRRRSTIDHPDLPTSSMDQITVEYLRPTLLLAPLRGQRQQQLAESGFLALPVRSLTTNQQQQFLQFLLVTLKAEGLFGPTPGSAAHQQWALELLSAPQARVEYRLVYGDAWSDIVLVVRVGYPDRWTTATLAGTVASLPDGRALDAPRTPATESADLGRRLTSPFSIAGLNADQAIGGLARAANVKLIADSYARPAIYRPKERTETLTGLTLREALDAVARAYGFYWWHQDGWFYVRHRLWPEEDRVMVADRHLRPLGLSVRQNSRIDNSGLDFLGTLSDERLMTINLVGHAQGRADAPASVFDLNEIDLIQRGLDYARALAPAQRDLAGSGNLPLSYLSPTQQSDFAAIGYDYGFLVDVRQIDGCAFRLNQTMGAPTRGYVDGMLVVQVGFGGGRVRSASLSMRLPVPEEPIAGKAATPAP